MDEEIKKSAKRLLAQRELARRRYTEYLAYVNGGLWIRTKLSTFLAETVQQFIEADTGNAYDILIIETPPQHGKSLTITEALPSWYLGKYPDNRVIEVSYNGDTAERFGRLNKDKVSQFGKHLFGVEVGSINKVDEFNLAGHRGQMLSRGIMAGITGNPANLLLIDDPIKTREEADSATRRSKIWGEWLSSIKTRLAAKAKVILIMTPWHEDDLRSRLLATEQNIRRIRLPVEAEDADELGRVPGEPLCPEIGKDDVWLAQFKRSYLASEEGGARAWSALYMCNPVIEGGNIVQRAWWKYYNPTEVTQFATEVISIDATFKDTNNSDFVAIQVWGKLDGNYYLRYNLNKRMDFPTTVRALMLVRSLYPRAFTILIEDKANGSAIIQTLQQEYHMTGVLPVNPKGGKVARVNAVSPAIESGHVFLPEGAPWLEEYLRQWSEFPAGKHDDMVDATSQCLNRMIYSSGIIDLPIENDHTALMAKREQDAFLGEALWCPYESASGRI